MSGSFIFGDKIRMKFAHFCLTPRPEQIRKYWEIEPFLGIIIVMPELIGTSAFLIDQHDRTDKRPSSECCVPLLPA